MSSRNRNKSENNSIDLEITEKQQEFIEAEATEVLFGGAAGGGKSYRRYAVRIEISEKQADYIQKDLS